MERQEAQAALQAVRHTNDQLADLQAHACPPWRHAAFGAVEAVLVLGASANGWPMWVLYSLSMLCAVVLMRSDRRRTGTWVNGWRRGRTLPLTAALCVAIAGLIFWARQDYLQPFPSPSGLAAAAVAFIGGTLASLWWQHIYIAELRRRVAP